MTENDSTRPAESPEIARLGLTKKFLESTRAPKHGRIFLHDKVQGLSFCVRESGHKSWYWQRKVAGRPEWKMVGLWPECTIDRARARANELNVALDEWRHRGWQGPSPLAESERGKTTFGQLCDLYVAKHIRQHAVHPEDAAMRFEWMLKKYLSALLTRKLAAISGDTLRELHLTISEKNGRVVADRCIQLVRRVFFWAIKSERCFSGSNPATEVNFNGSQKRDRYLRSDELARLFAALKEEPNADLRDFVVLSLFCGTRKSDTMSMRWEDLSLDDNVWRVPMPKGGKPYQVPLVPEVVELLRERKAATRAETNRSQGSLAPRTNGSIVWVFPSPVFADRHIREFKRPWTQLLERAQIANFTVHDMRRTFGSFQAGSGTSLAIIGKSLGHAPGSNATSVYARLDLQPVKDSMMRATRLMLAAAEPVKALPAAKKRKKRRA